MVDSVILPAEDATAVPRTGLSGLSSDRAQRLLDHSAWLKNSTSRFTFGSIKSCDNSNNGLADACNLARSKKSRETDPTKTANPLDYPTMNPACCGSYPCAFQSGDAGAPLYFTPIAKLTRQTVAPRADLVVIFRPFDNPSVAHSHNGETLCFYIYL